MGSTPLKNRKSRWTAFFNGDPVIWIVFFILCAISIIEVYSATSTLSYKDGLYWRPVINHSIYRLLGFLVVFVFHNIPCRWFKLYPLLMIPISVILLLLVPFVGEKVNGAQRVIPIMGIPVQPSELAKGAVVVAVALILSVMQTPKGADRHAFKYIMIPTSLVCLLIAPDNFSTAAILFIVVFMMMFVGHIPFRQLGSLLGILAIVGASVVGLMFVTPNNQLGKIPKGHRLVTWKNRIDKFVSNKDENTRELSAKDFDMTNNAQVGNANIAIATSNIVGKLPGNSVQRDFLSQAYSDFIYAIIIEELGLIGSAGVLMLYIILCYRAGRIARQCERNFPAFLVIGLSLLIVFQAMINMCVAVGLMPVTGQPLPFVSRGGASTLVNSIYIGMILSVSRFAKKREDTPAVSSAVNEEAFHDETGIS